MTYRMSTRKKLAIATWTAPTEGNIFGKLTLDLSLTLPYIDYVRDVLDTKISITHIVGCAVARTLKKAPDINGRIFMGRHIPHKSTDIAFLVSLEGGSDLAKVKICDVDTKTTMKVAEELHGRAGLLRSGKDEEFKKSKPLLRLLPTWIIRPIVWLSGFITAGLGLELKFLGLEKFPFGSCVITSVGMFGIDEGYAPQIPFARVPVYIAITKIKNRVVPIDGKLIVRPELDLMATIDHRFMDGHQGSRLAREIRDLIEHPWKIDGFDQMPFSEKKRSLSSEPQLSVN